MALAPAHPPLAEPLMAGNILVGVDGSVGAQRALAYAATLARNEHGRLTLLAVVPPPIWTRMAIPPPGYDHAVKGCHDLVVVGCEGRGLLHGAIGGVSRKVCRRCPVPVLVVRDAVPAESLALR